MWTNFSYQAYYVYNFWTLAIRYSSNLSLTEMALKICNFEQHQTFHNYIR